MFRLLSLCCRHLCNLTPPPTSSEQFSQGYLRSCLPGLSPKNLHQIKHNSQLLGCDYFLSQHHWREALSKHCCLTPPRDPQWPSALQGIQGLREWVSTAPQEWMKVDVPYWFLGQPAGLSQLRKCQWSTEVKDPLNGVNGRPGLTKKPTSGLGIPKENLNEIPPQLHKGSLGLEWIFRLNLVQIHIPKAILRCPKPSEETR